MRKWLDRSLIMFRSDPADSPYQRGFRDALIQAKRELDCIAENRKILIAKLGVVSFLAAIVIAVTWALFA